LPLRLKNANSQYAKKILNEIACNRGSESIFFKSQIEGHRIHQLGSLTDSGQFRLNQLSSLAGRF